MLGDHDFGAALVEIGDDGIAVEGYVGDQSAEGQPVAAPFTLSLRSADSPSCHR